MTQTCGGSGAIEVGKSVPWGDGVWDLCPGCSDCRIPPSAPVLPEYLRGDGPCADCGTSDNIVWFADNKLWNDVVRPDGGMDAILCIPCFVVRADASGLKRGAWVLTPAAGLYEQVDVP